MEKKPKTAQAKTVTNPNQGEIEHENISIVNNVNVNDNDGGSEENDKDCGCCGELPCCYFDVYMTRVRVTENKDAFAELMLTGYANTFAAPFPSMGCWFQIHKKWGWRSINKLVGRFCVKQGQTMQVLLSADAIEAGRLGEGNWDFGTAQEVKYLTLECGKTTANYVHVETQRPKNLDSSVTCKLDIEFVAFPVNGCCC